MTSRLQVLCPLLFWSTGAKITAQGTKKEEIRQTSEDKAQEKRRAFLALKVSQPHLFVGWVWDWLGFRIKTEHRQKLLYIDFNAINYHLRRILDIILQMLKTGKLKTKTTTKVQDSYLHWIPKHVSLSTRAISWYKVGILAIPQV